MCSRHDKQFNAPMLGTAERKLYDTDGDKGE